jgi:UDP-N-acetylmuramate: L-alanyl-gamma-D-glutamyl-meso-diaminopimelate ligase
MSDQLAQAGIEVFEGYEPAHLSPEPDLVVMGNAMTRGNPAVEYVLNKGLPYTSGPQWLSQHVLQGRWVLAVSGTHGKTTTSSLLAWILDYAGMAPGFLIGGVPDNFGETARLGDTPFFVIEADEYDTAFFDKRSKFVHYLPRTLVINNLEFDHADIFDDLAAIQRQFHHVIRTVPSEGRIIAAPDKAVAEVLELGCWSECETLGSDWKAELINKDGSAFVVTHQAERAEVNWSLVGLHNVNNAMAAMAAAHHVGVTLNVAAEALASFVGVKRRLELKGEVNDIRVYDDFAHHPTAIATTVAGLRARIGNRRLIAVLEPRSNTMKMGVHQDTLAQSLIQADRVMLFQDKGLKWSLKDVSDRLGDQVSVHESVEDIVAVIKKESKSGDEILVMSNGGFGGIHQKILEAL